MILAGMMRDSWKRDAQYEELMASALRAETKAIEAKTGFYELQIDVLELRTKINSVIDSLERIEQKLSESPTKVKED